MAENKELVVLRLEGVLQSWGSDSKWDFRNSDSMPTKSGIVGLLGCAMGVERGSELLADLSQAITIAVRADRPGTKCVDFQTVNGNPMLTVSGTPRKDATGGPANTIITKRAYLQDAIFTVIIDVNDDYWKERIIDALKNPKWCIYLGRRSCIPSRPVYQGTTDKYESVMDAVKGYPAAYRAQYPMNYECEVPQLNAVSLVRGDDLVGANRKFALRRVWRGKVKEDDNVSQ